MENTFGQIEGALELLKIDLSKGQQIAEQLKNIEEDKKIKKRLKKYIPIDNQPIQNARDKVNKLLEELYKHFEKAGKFLNRTKLLKNAIDASNIQKQNALNQKNMMESLQANFRKKYQEEIKKAQAIENEEQQKQKKMVDNLQEKIKEVQNRYEVTGRRKIQLQNENETLKHELAKREPYLMSAQTLAETQLKKKDLEIQIQMSTMKQKIEMMGNFQTMRSQTEKKLIVSKQTNHKLNQRLSKMQAKQDQHKIILTKAHLLFEEYKKAINNLKNQLLVKEKEAAQAKAKFQKSEQSLKDLRRKLAQMDNEYGVQKDQLKMLQTLEQSLKQQLQS